MTPKIQEERIRPLATEEAQKLLKQEDFRIKVREIICEYAGSVDFEELTQKYAGKEIDKRALSGSKYWKNIIITTLITAITTTILTIFATLFLMKK